MSFFSDLTAKHGFKELQEGKIEVEGGSKEKEMKRLDQGEEERDSTVAHPVEEPGGRVAPLFVDQTKAQRAEKMFLEATPPPPPYLKVWSSTALPLPPFSFVLVTLSRLDLFFAAAS